MIHSDLEIPSHVLGLARQEYDDRELCREVEWEVLGGGGRWVFGARYTGVRGVR